MSDNPTNAQNDPEFPALEAYVKSVIGDNPTTGEWMEHTKVSAGIIKDLREQLAAEREVGHNTAVALAQQITKLEDQVKELQEKLDTILKSNKK